MRMNYAVRMCLSVAGLAAVLGGNTNVARAQAAPQEKPPIYTWVTLWGFPRASWPDYTKAVAATSKTLENFVSSGDLVSTASFTTLVHEEGGVTHGRFWTSKTLSGDLKALEALRSDPQNTSPVLSGARHWDEVMVSRHYASKPGTYTNVYMRVQQWHPGDGAGDPQGKILSATLVPLLDKLLANGSLYMYQIDTQLIHTEDPGSIWIVFASNGAEGQDAVNEAIDDMQKSHPENGGRLLDSDHLEGPPRRPLQARLSDD
jgi:hypothetical protein